MVSQLLKLTACRKLEFIRQALYIGYCIVVFFFLPVFCCIEINPSVTVGHEGCLNTLKHVIFQFDLITILKM
jgi:hypothetical protein